MHCVIKSDMKFGDYLIKARTKARVIGKPNYKQANIPGLDLYLAVTLSDIALKKEESVLVSDVEIKNELDKKSRDTVMVGITIRTDGTKVFMDAGDSFYEEATIYESEVKKVLGVEDIPEKIEKVKYLSPTSYYLIDVVEYLEREFAKWVQDNCEFYTYTEEDIENRNCGADDEPGDVTLSDIGMEQFETKKIEYQKMLEKIGFTYDFKGGLVWE
ncbi:hypothetical protein [uncultured Clostridium sp.]|uniref:hypothetical protein n=1 Tax=uncultured Clostridium sp. TaxID=59620 RepID=UPI0028EE495D|nr:hypothetical protein [uncultured Clostridium sp.]